MNSKIKDTIHTIDGYEVDPNSYGTWTRDRGFPVKIADEESKKKEEVC